MSARVGPLAIVLCAAAVLTSTVAQAQEARAVDVGVGSQWLDAADQSYPLGVVADASGPIIGSLRWLGEVAFARDSGHDREFGVDASLTAITFAGGTRWSFAAGRLRPYVQAVAGSQRDAYVLSAEGAGELISETATAGMFQPGAGIMFPLAERWVVFAQADLRRVFYDEGSEDFLRVAAGVRLSFRLLTPPSAAG